MYTNGVIYIGVGFCVARSDDNGQSRASECGTGNKGFHAFFISITKD